MSRHRYNIHKQRDYTYICPPGFISTANLAELAGILRGTVIKRCTRAYLIPKAVPRVNAQGLKLGGRPLFLYPKDAALHAVFTQQQD